VNSRDGIKVAGNNNPINKNDAGRRDNGDGRDFL